MKRCNVSSGQVLWRCLFGSGVVIGLILSLFFSTSSFGPVTLIFYGALVLLYLSTVIIFVVAAFDRFQTGKRGDRFLALFNLSIFPIMMIALFATIYKTIGLVEDNTMVKRPLDFSIFQ
jgi:hypothetical protein